jgi:hypothetical protein
VLLQQPNCQLTGECTSLLLTLVEGDESILLVRVEHEIKNGLGLLEPLLAQAVARRERGWGHRRTPRSRSPSLELV